MNECELVVALLAAFLGLSLVGNVGLCWLRKRKQQEEESPEEEPAVSIGEPSPAVVRSKPPLREGVRTPAVDDVDAVRHYTLENERLTSIIKLREREKQELWEQLHRQQPPPSAPSDGSLFARAHELLYDPAQLSTELNRLETVWLTRNDRYASAMKELKELRSKSDPLSNEMVANTITALTAREKDLSHKLTLSTRQQSAAAERCTKLENENAAVKKELFSNKKKHKEDFQQLLDELTGLQQEYGGKQVTQQQLAASQREAAVLRSQLQQERDANEDAAREIERLGGVEAQYLQVCDKMKRLESELTTRPVLTVPSPAPVPVDSSNARDLRLVVVGSPRKHTLSPLLSPAEHNRLTKPTARSNKRHPLLEMSPANRTETERRSPILSNPLDSWG